MTDAKKVNKKILQVQKLSNFKKLSKRNMKLFKFENNPKFSRTHLRAKLDENFEASGKKIVKRRAASVEFIGHRNNSKKSKSPNKLLSRTGSQSELLHFKNKPSIPLNFMYN